MHIALGLLWRLRPNLAVAAIALTPFSFALRVRLCLLLFLEVAFPCPFPALRRCARRALPPTSLRRPARPRARSARPAPSPTRLRAARRPPSASRARPEPRSPSPDQPRATRAASESTRDRSESPSAQTAPPEPTPMLPVQLSASLGQSKRAQHTRSRTSSPLHLTSLVLFACPLLPTADCALFVCLVVRFFSFFLPAARTSTRPRAVPLLPRRAVPARPTRRAPPPALARSTAACRRSASEPTTRCLDDRRAWPSAPREVKRHKTATCMASRSVVSD